MSLLNSETSLFHIGIATTVIATLSFASSSEAKAVPAIDCCCDDLPLWDDNATPLGQSKANAETAESERPIEDSSGRSALDSEVQIIAEQRKLIDEQNRILAKQSKLIEDQGDIIEKQNTRIDQLEDQVQTQQVQIDTLTLVVLSNPTLDRARGAGMIQGPLPGLGSETVSLPDRPVGEAPPPEPQIEQRVAAVPEGLGVLTPPGRLVFEPSIEYTRSSTNRLVFRGIELIPGIQIGLIEATDADRDTLAMTGALRFGITNRLEAEIRVPYLYRNDRIEVAQQRDEGIVRQIALREHGFGDVEFSLRYQFNRPVGQKPIFVGTLRVKSPTGKGPFDVDYDEFGVATGLATGSGFWAVQPGLNFLMPSDPAVIYGGIAYLYHVPKNLNKLVGDALVGRVDPGDAISANLGFGFALNPRFSFSLGYRHNYIFPTQTEIGGTDQRSKYLHVGSLNLGMSYRLTEKETLNIGFEFGVTSDAPDVSITLRSPISFKF